MSFYVIITKRILEYNPQATHLIGKVGELVDFENNDCIIIVPVKYGQIRYQFNLNLGEEIPKSKFEELKKKQITD